MSSGTDEPPDVAGHRPMDMAPTWKPEEQKPAFRCATCSADLDTESRRTWHEKNYCYLCFPSARRNNPDPVVTSPTTKPRYDLIPADSLHAIALVLASGAEKYEDRGWESGERWGKCFSSCMGHLWSWWRGERNDQESGLPHLAHAACRVMFLLAYECRGVGEDDRTGGEGDGSNDRRRDISGKR